MQPSAMGMVVYMSSPRGLTYLSQIRFDLGSRWDDIHFPIKAPLLADGRIRLSFSYFGGLDLPSISFPFRYPFSHATLFFSLISILSLIICICSITHPLPILSVAGQGSEHFSNLGPPSELARDPNPATRADHVDRRFHLKPNRPPVIEHPPPKPSHWLLEAT